MTGKVVYLKWITRSMLQQEPEARFVFGDNAQRKGFGGQAKEMRGEPNAVGIATKWAPLEITSAYFSDHDQDAWDLVREDLAQITKLLDEGRTIYVPEAGLGTGLSRLPELAPKIHKAIHLFFQRISGPGFPWPEL